MWWCAPVGSRAVATKTKEMLDKKIKEYKEYLLELQQQKDLYETLRKEIWDRCACREAAGSGI